MRPGTSRTAPADARRRGRPRAARDAGRARGRGARLLRRAARHPRDRQAPGARRPGRRVVRERAPQGPPGRRPRLPPRAESAPRAPGDRPRGADRAAPRGRARGRRRRAVGGLSPRVRQRPVRQSPRADGAAAVRRGTHDGRRYSNAAAARFELVDYNPGWPALFEAEAGRLRAILAGLDLGPFRLEHFGSTAIPGITAKPIIDIMLVAAGQPRGPGLVDPIKSLDYVYWAENPRSDRMFFVKGMPPFGTRRTHHVHVRTPE